MAIRDKSVGSQMQTSEEQTAWINCLPPEILLQIFANLPLQTLSSCALVCKNWHALSQDDLLWRFQCLHFNLSNAPNALPRLKSFDSAFNRGDILHRKPIISFHQLEESKFGVLRGRFYASATLKPDDPIKIWDLETNQVVTSFDSTKNLEGVTSMHFHDEYLACLISRQDKENTIMIFGKEDSPREVQIGECHTIVCHESVIGFTSDSWADHNLYLIAVATGEIRHTLRHDGLIGSSIYFSDRCIASGDSNDTNRIWDIETGELVHAFPNDGGARNLLIKKEIFISTYGKEVKIHNLQKKSSYTLTMKREIEAIDLQGNILAMHLSNGCLCLLNITTKKTALFTEKKYIIAEGVIYAKKIQWSGFKLYVVLSNGGLQVWDFSKEPSSESTFSKLMKWIH